MRNLTLIVAALAVVVILTGCGHNAIQYGDGVGFDVGINPENCMLSMNLRYGKILSAVTRNMLHNCFCRCMPICCILPTSGKVWHFLQWRKVRCFGSRPCASAGCSAREDTSFR